MDLLEELNKDFDNMFEQAERRRKEREQILAEFAIDLIDSSEMARRLNAIQWYK